MGGKVSRFFRNYDAERRAMKLLAEREGAAEPTRAPRYSAERELQRRLASDRVLEAAVKEKDAKFVSNLRRMGAVQGGSSPPGAEAATESLGSRPLPQRRHYEPSGDLGVLDVNPESVPAGRLTLHQFERLLMTNSRQGDKGEPQVTGGASGVKLPPGTVEQLLGLYAPLEYGTKERFDPLFGSINATDTAASSSAAGRESGQAEDGATAGSGAAGKT